MRDLEIKILKAIDEFNALPPEALSLYPYESMRALLIELVDSPFKSTSSAFLNDPRVDKFVQNSDVLYRIKEVIRLECFVLIEKYLLGNENDDNAAFGNLSKIKSFLHGEFDKNVVLNARRMLFNPIFIRNIYLSNDKDLIKAIKEFLPSPPSTLFSSSNMPETIAAEKKSLEACKKTLLSKRTLDELTASAIVLQRIFRKKRRMREENKRIITMYKDYLDWYIEKNEFLFRRTDWDSVNYKATPSEGGKLLVRALINEASSPYLPKSNDKKLNMRIFRAAERVKLFGTIKHFTSAASLSNIFDNGLYGRKTLEDMLLSYKPSALSAIDARNGDGNAICFGPNEIDPKSIQEDHVEIILNFDTMDKSNPCMFYKQRDLGFTLKRQYRLYQNDDSLTFNPTVPNDGGTALTFFTKDNQKSAVFTVPNFMLIAYDVKRIHQILTLNFFRFLDGACDYELQAPRHKYEAVKKKEKLKENEMLRSAIYKKLAEMNEVELVNFLQNLGIQLTDTAEFNFYGAYQLDFSTIIALKTPNYTLNMSSFIASLQNGEVATLEAAEHNIPSLFKSYRFISYLLENVKNANVIEKLNTYRQHCPTPEWQATPQNAALKK